MVKAAQAQAQDSTGMLKAARARVTWDLMIVTVEGFNVFFYWFNWVLEKIKNISVLFL